MREHYLFFNFPRWGIAVRGGGGVTGHTKKDVNTFSSPRLTVNVTVKCQICLITRDHVPPMTRTVARTVTREAQ